MGILHGKVNYYLYKQLSEENDYAVARSEAKRIKNLTNKIYRPYKVLTPFQLLKSFFGIKGFEQHISEMTNGLFILDEIHAYDPHTTALIIEMLKILKSKFNASIFIMSATIPNFLKNIIKKELNISNEIRFTNQELLNYTRHEVNIIPGSIRDNYDLILKDITTGKRILVVCNTVKTAQTVFRTLRPHCPNSALIHSRFILKDREELEKQFETLDLLVGTQAIEVSLDISFDTLYTEPAPIDALIQRLGRVNRKGWEKDTIAPVYIFDTGSDNDKYIYNPELIENTVKLLKGKEKSFMLHENLIQKLEDKIYNEGFTSDEWDKYINVKNNFRKFFESTIPFFNNPEGEINFYSLYKSFEVVPYEFMEEYNKSIKEKRFLEAMSFSTSITRNQFFKLKKEDRIFTKDNTILVDAKYDTDLGLLLNKPAPKRNII